jgi:hypothetical protein
MVMTLAGLAALLIPFSPKSPEYNGPLRKGRRSITDFWPAKTPGKHFHLAFYRQAGKDGF